MNRTLVALLVLAGQAFAEPALSAEQQQKLDALQAMFRPGGSTGSSGYGIEKAQEFCGAAIPLELDPSTVLYDDPKKTPARPCRARATASRERSSTCAVTRRTPTPW